MADSHALALDTSTEALSLQRARWAAATSARKFEMLRSLCRDARELGLAGIRDRHPGATEREQTLRLGSLTIERALMIEAFGWDPDREGR